MESDETAINVTSEGFHKIRTSCSEFHFMAVDIDFHSCFVEFLDHY